MFFDSFEIYIVGSRGSSQLGGSLLGIPLGYKANKLLVSLSYPVGIINICNATSIGIFY